jgi:hypothetical protein
VDATMNITFYQLIEVIFIAVCGGALGGLLTYVISVIFKKKGNE